MITSTNLQTKMGNIVMITAKIMRAFEKFNTKDVS